VDQIDETQFYRLVGGVVLVVLVVWLFLVFTESQASATLLSQWQAVDLYSDHHGYLPLILK
jgi:hypothetical protein